MKQVRFIPIESCGLHVRDAGEGEAESRMVEGTPIIFGVRSVNLTPWSDTREVYEILEPGCISEDLLQRSDVILNINHSTMVTDVLGRCKNGQGTLSLQNRGTHIESSCDLPHTNCANDTLELIRRGDISGMSFAFSDDPEDSENGVSYERTAETTANGKEVWLRHVKRVTGLYDVSIVTHPAYEQTGVGVREQGDAMLRSIDEQILASERKQRDADADAKAKEEEENRRLEEEAERARQMQEYRRRTQRRHLNENIINY